MSYFSKVQIKDQYGFAAENTPMDEVRAVTPIRLSGATFNGTTIDPNFWTSTLANNGTAAQANNQIVLGASTTNNGSSILQTVARARYTGGSSNRFRAQLAFSTATASNTRRWGMFDGTDGAYFKLDGTDLKACVTRGGVINEVTVATLTKPTEGDVTTYEIYVTNAKVYFIMAGVLVATHLATTATWSDTLNLPIRLDNINAGSTTNCTLTARVATIYRFGQLETAPRFFHGTTAATTTLKYGAGMLHRIMLNNPAGTLITIYDDTTGTGNVIAVINAPEQANPVTLEYKLPFSNGLKVVTTGTWDYTLIYE
jgi:hypothetical protein